MKQSLKVHFVPSLTSPEALRGATVVMLDVLRASTSIIQAMSAGALRVIPLTSIDQAKIEGQHHERENIVLGGERRWQFAG